MFRQSVETVQSVRLTVYKIFIFIGLEANSASRLETGDLEAFQTLIDQGSKWIGSHRPRSYFSLYTLFKETEKTRSHYISLTY